MSYSTIADLILEITETTLIELTDDAGSGSVDAATAERAIADADEIINSRLSIRYTLPFLDTPGLIRKISVDLAVFGLYSRKGEPPETRTVQYEEALRLLDKIGSGEVKLDAMEKTDGAREVQWTTKKSGRIFTTGPDGTLENM